jgi:acetoin utilization deacetylase AcuC-like enzyme
VLNPMESAQKPDMTTLILTHPACLDHDTGTGHPESPARLKAVLAALDKVNVPGLASASAPLVTEEALARVHAPAMIAQVLEAVPEVGYAYLDNDTVVAPGSKEAGLRAAGAGIAAVDAVLGGDADNAFCATRPPGHHATAGRAMGFCLFNNLAVAAFYARAVHGIERIAALDFDVHHGNGTEDIFRGQAGLFFASSHEYPNYPGTGGHSEDGSCPILNAPLARQSTGQDFCAVWSERLLPALAAFEPELILVSAGFDGHRKDPLSMMQLEVADFSWLSTEIRRQAEASCAGRVVSFLEGGYDLDALAASAAAYVTVQAAP